MPRQSIWFQNVFSQFFNGHALFVAIRKGGNVQGCFGCAFFDDQKTVLKDEQKLDWVWRKLGTVTCQLNKHACGGKVKRCKWMQWWRCLEDKRGRINGMEIGIFWQISKLDIGIELEQMNWNGFLRREKKTIQIFFKEKKIAKKRERAVKSEISLSKIKKGNENLAM